MKIKKISIAIIAIVGLFFIFSESHAQLVSFAGGSGTKVDPYKISNCAELQDMSTDLGAYYILTKNIDCSATGISDSGNSKYDANLYNEGAGFNPIGSFSGTLDGQEYAISNLNINRNDTVGLFSLTDGATIENLKIDNAEIFGNEKTGTLVADASNSVFKNIIVNDTTVTAHNETVGGIAAKLTSSSLEKSSFSGTVSGGDRTGGVAGEIRGNSSISESYSIGLVSGGYAVGGLIGYSVGSTIANSYSKSDVDGENDSIGGLIGDFMAQEPMSLYQSYSSGTVTGDNNVGGLVGSMNSEDIHNSFTVGSVNCSGDFCGSAVGFYGWSSLENLYWNKTDSEQNCYAEHTDEGSVSGNENCTAIDNNESYFYNASNDIYTVGEYKWVFAGSNPIWDQNVAALPTLHVFAADNQSNNNDNNSTKPKIISWSAYQYQDNSYCAQRLNLTINGHRFDKNVSVFIGNKESSSINRKSSQKIIAKFCLTKLLDNQTDHKRVISVKNPNASKETADKQIDLENISYNLSVDDFNMQTSEGIKNIQTVLNKLGYLDSQYITGIYGANTTQAVTKFQADNGLSQTGIVGPMTREKLREKSS